MQKQTIIVPRGINYISDWVDFTLLKGHYIVDKKVTGCGFTQYCITNNLPTILCSPRKLLLENKNDQHKDLVFYVNNTAEKTLGTDIDLTLKKSKIDDTAVPGDTNKLSETAQYILDLINDIRVYVQNCYYLGKVPKILVTYDSLKHVLSALGPALIGQFYVVVDEFQSIFTDSRFKGSVEMNFLDYLQDCPNVCYVSATPMIEEYLDQLVEFKDLPYYELDWATEDICRVINPNIDIRYTKVPIKEVCNLIKEYRTGKYDTAVIQNSSSEIVHIQSKEIVFYVNSVRMICTIIKKMELTPAETNILCAKTTENQSRLKKIKHDFGTVPLNGQPHKMFTFCTRTVYLGADFYSTCARTVIISDSNIECMAVDISLDLPQILGRQRLDSNPWKNRALMFCKTTRKRISQEELEKKINKKLESTRNTLNIYKKSIGTPGEENRLRELVKCAFSVNHYSDDYSSVSEKTGDIVMNNLVLVAERRAFEVIQKDYRDWVCVLNRVTTGMTASKVSDTPIQAEVKIFLLNFKKASDFISKMRLYCESSISDEAREIINTEIPIEYSNYYKYLGPKLCKSNKYQKGDIEKCFNKKYLEEQSPLVELIFSSFPIKLDKKGKPSFYSLVDTKSILQNIYDSLEIEKIAKASDIEEYYETRRGKKDGINGYYLIKQKS